MTKISKLFGIVTFIVIIGFMMIACEEEGEEGSKFVGTWIGTITKESDIDSDIDNDAILVITDSTWKITSSISSVNGATGTCSFSTIQASLKNDSEFTIATATVILGNLSLNGSSDGNHALKGVRGTFAKEVSQAGNKFIGTWNGSVVDKEGVVLAEDAKIVFAETTWTLSSVTVPAINKNGTYKVNSLFGTAALKEGNNSFGTATIFFNDSLTISAGDNGSGSFIKDGVLPDTSITGTWTGTISKGGQDEGISATITFNDPDGWAFSSALFNSSGKYEKGSYSTTLKTNDDFTFGTFTVIVGKLNFTGGSGGPARGYTGSFTKN